MPTTQVTNPETKVISEQKNNMLLLCETDTYLSDYAATVRKLMFCYVLSYPWGGANKKGWFYI